MMYSAALPGDARVDLVSLLQGPEASVLAVRRVRSRHRGTDDGPAGGSTKSGGKPTGSIR